MTVCAAFDRILQHKRDTSGLFKKAPSFLLNRLSIRSCHGIIDSLIFSG
jgi:hypothetical protein